MVCPFSRQCDMQRRAQRDSCVHKHLFCSRHVPWSVQRVTFARLVPLGRLVPLLQCPSDKRLLHFYMLHPAALWLQVISLGSICAGAAASATAVCRRVRLVYSCNVPAHTSGVRAKLPGAGSEQFTGRS